jgi:hypothetical protein
MFMELGLLTLKKPEDLLRDFPLAEGPHFIPVVEDQSQAGRAASISFQPFFEGNRLDQISPSRLDFLVFEDLTRKEAGGYQPQASDESPYPPCGPDLRPNHFGVFPVKEFSGPATVV